MTEAWGGRGELQNLCPAQDDGAGWGGHFHGGESDGSPRRKGAGGPGSGRHEQERRPLGPRAVGARREQQRKDGARGDKRANQTSVKDAPATGDAGGEDAGTGGKQDAIRGGEEHKAETLWGVRVAPGEAEERDGGHREDDIAEQNAGDAAQETHCDQAIVSRCGVTGQRATGDVKAS